LGRGGAGGLLVMMKDGSGARCINWELVSVLEPVAERGERG